MKRNDLDEAATADPMEAIREDLAALKRDFSSLIGQKAGQAAGKGRDAYDAAKDYAAQGHDKLSDIAGERPLTVILVALAAGAVLGAVIGSRRGRD